ncbi:hypothetical protein HD806DRAFT_510526 [Xylariaceae sp. AK1471]|nr:hypothetical protein HD806DRAFT_510526 [Xylariaceae sp. AK1471]
MLIRREKEESSFLLLIGILSCLMPTAGLSYPARVIIGRDLKRTDFPFGNKTSSFNVQRIIQNPPPPASCYSRLALSLAEI